MIRTTLPDIRTATAPQRALASVGFARATLELRAFFREKDAVIFIFAYPTAMLLIFGTVVDDEVAAGVSFPQYFVAGMLAAGLMLASFESLATTIAVERDNGSLKRLAGTPMPRSAYFLGKIGLVLGIAAPQTVLLVGTAALVFHVPLPTTADRWLTYAWVSLLSAATGTLAGVAFSSVPRSGRSAGPVTASIMLVLQFISGVFFPFDELPPWMQTVAAVLPLKWIAQGMRSVFLPESLESTEVSHSWQHLQIASVLVLWAVAALVLCLRTFRWLRPDEM